MLFSKDISYGEAGGAGGAGGAGPGLSGTSGAPGAPGAPRASWNNRGEMLEDATTEDATTAEATSESIPIPTHPLGVKPLGNQYFASGPIARQSLGNLGLLPDEMLLQFLEYLDPHSLSTLGTTCRFLYAFCHSDELWKPLFLE